MPMITLALPDGDSAAAYLAGDDAADAAILLLHEWWGVKPHNIELADRFAAEGFQALVLDLYDGRVTDDAEQAAEWMRTLDQTTADRKLLAALDFLARPDRRLATYGCSMGGKESLLATLLAPERVAATVMAYCRMETDGEKLARLRGPVLAIYAEQERNWPQKQHDFEAAMAAAGKATEARGYDAAHGFTNPDSPRFDAAAEQDHFRVVVDFLNRALKTAN